MIKIMMIMTLCISIGICSSCKCSQLLTILDCQQASCNWSEGICQEVSSSTTTTSNVIATHCETYSSFCLSLEGCAYYNSKCIPFSGCESYNVQTSDQCQQISSKCNYNGSYCVEGTNCQDQVDETNCLNVKLNFMSACKWSGSVCEVLQCSDAPQKSMVSTECEAFLTNCIAIANGNGCIAKTSGKKCSSYTLSGQNVCSGGLKADDGNCFWNSITKTCDVILCESATSSNTDEQCQLIDSKCITTGYGCTDVLKTCDSYFEEGSKLCSLLTGTDGICKKQSTSNQCEAVGCNLFTEEKPCIAEQKCKWDGNVCRQIRCEDASTDYTTDVACQGFMNNCRTNGNGCYTLLRGYTCEDLQMLDQCTLKSNCYWEQSKCHTFTKCEDLKSNCTAVSPSCQYSMGVCTTKKACGTKTSSNCQSDQSCAWNQTSGKCTTFVNCESAELTNYAQCSTYNSSCGNAQTKCISKTQCEQYSTEQLCQIGDNSGGTCIFENNSCRSIICLDLVYTKHNECYIYSNSKCISNGSTCQDLQCSLITDQPNCSLYECTYDGTKCIDKATKCSQYLTRDVCISTSVDVCVFVNNVCSVFTKCSDANNSQSTCEANNCYYSDSECKMKTCEQRNSTDCTFYQLDTIIQSCQLNNYVCQNADQSILTQDQCYLNSNGEYFWDTYFGKCTSCSADSLIKTNYTYFVYQPNTSVKIVYSYGCFLIGLIGFIVLS